MKTLIGIIILGFIAFGNCATPFKTLKDRLSKEQCKQKLAGMKKQRQPFFIDVNPTCEIGKVSFMYSRGQLQLSFWRDYPYQICLVELRRFDVLRAWDDKEQELRAMRDGNNVCFQNTNPDGGTVYILLNPKGFTYMSEVYYEIQKLQTSGTISSATSVRDRRPLLNTTPPPVRRFQSFQDVITPIPRIRDLGIQPPVVTPRRIPSQTPLPLSRQWFIRRLPVFINRVREDARSNVVQRRDNIRMRQGDLRSNDFQQRDNIRMRQGDLRSNDFQQRDNIRMRQGDLRSNDFQQRDNIRMRQGGARSNDFQQRDNIRMRQGDLRSNDFQQRDNIRMRQLDARSNVVQQRDNIRLRQGLHRFFGQ